MAQRSTETTGYTQDVQELVENLRLLQTRPDDPQASGTTWGRYADDDVAEEDVPRDACGVFGCVLTEDAAKNKNLVSHVIYLGLVALQHRGQESAGMVMSEGGSTKEFTYHKGQGLVASIFNDAALNKLQGALGVGHTRYSTAGGRDPKNTQPFMVHTRHGPLAVAHNGELINANALRSTVLDRGVGLSTYSDSELITQMLSLTPPKGEASGPDWPARIRHLMEASPTAYSLVLMNQNKIFGVRDPFGNRPLCIGKLMPVGEASSSPSDNSPSKPLGWVISSESCAFQSIGAHLLREVHPGEIVELSSSGVRSLDQVGRPKTRPIVESHPEEEHMFHQVMPVRAATLPAFCIFEYVYFSRPDSIYEGQQVYTVRMRCGRQLALETAVDADIISTVPESATPAALGYSMETGLPYVEVLCKNRYVGRSFIQPDQRSRQLSVAKKFGAISDNLAGQRVVIVDDSIVRGTTVGPIIRLLKDAGAKEVHIRVASPPIRHPCYMGINIPTRKELIANHLTPEQLGQRVGADSLRYLSIEGLVKAVTSGISEKRPAEDVGHCTACLSGEYPVQLEF
ncbi:phosphoribosylamidotransferase 2 [Oratosquilla oratoria]|uniref:phosphoribosylamidotransferase 2 n=1 Tax=Oratosquilla oratoria TaxID=337810 RepID=UPI003F777213